MSNVIPFPGTVTALGFSFPAACLRCGMEEAERLGIGGDRLSALMERDRAVATYFLAHLGSADDWDRRVGEFRVRRLLENATAA